MPTSRSSPSAIRAACPRAPTSWRSQQLGSRPRTATGSCPTSQPWKETTLAMGTRATPTRSMQMEWSMEVEMELQQSSQRIPVQEQMWCKPRTEEEPAMELPPPLRLARWPELEGEARQEPLVAEELAAELPPLWQMELLVPLGAA